MDTKMKYIWVVVIVLLTALLAFGEELRVIEKARTHSFKNLSSMEGLWTRQQTTAQYAVFMESSARGKNKVVFAANSSLSADVILTVRSNGLFKGNTQLLSW